MARSRKAKKVRHTPEPTAVQQLRRIIRDAERAISAATVGEWWRPAKDSQAWREFEEEPSFRSQASKAPINDAYSVGALKLAAARDQLLSLEILLKPEMRPMGTAAIARTAAESAAGAWYMFDPAIKTRARVARGLTARLSSHAEASKLPLPAAKQQAVTRVAKIVKGADELKLKVFYDREHRPIGTMKPWPNATDLMRKIAGIWGEVLYRDTSAVVHGELWGLVGRMGVRKDPLGHHQNIAIPEVGDEIIVPMVAVTVDVFAAAVDRLVELMGWNAPEWHRWRDSTEAPLERFRGERPAFKRAVRG